MRSTGWMRPLVPHAVRQLRRVRSVYAAGTALWAVGLLLTVGEPDGGRQTLVFALLLVVFALLLCWASARLWAHATAVAAARRSRPARPGTGPGAAPAGGGPA
jgi:hypothetical protein